MKHFYSGFIFLIIFIISLHLFSFANEADDAKAVLVKSIPTLSGEGAVIYDPITIEEIEKRSLEEMSKCKNCPQVSFGFQNPKWEKFKSEYKAGDIILYFNTNNESWAGLYGREGYALVREEEIIDTILVTMN